MGPPKRPRRRTITRGPGMAWSRSSLREFPAWQQVFPTCDCSHVVNESTALLLTRQRAAEAAQSGAVVCGHWRRVDLFAFPGEIPCHWQGCPHIYSYSHGAAVFLFSRWPSTELGVLIYSPEVESHLPAPSKPLAPMIDARAGHLPR